MVGDVPYTDNLHSVWGEMMAPYGLYPLFPVRTNVQPGDVAIQCTRKVRSSAERLATASAPASSAGGAALDTPVEWVTLFSLSGVPEEARKYAESRMAYSAFATAVPSSATAPIGPASGADPYRTGQAGSIIGFASFPSILSYSKKRTDFGAGGAVGIASIGVGASNETNGYFTLEVPGAEVAELPFGALQNALSKTLKSADAVLIQTAMAAVSEAVGAKVCDPNSLSVVGAVYYTRHLTATMGDSYASAIEARAAYQLPVDSTRAEVYKALGSYANGASAPAAPGSSAFPTDSARMAQLMIDLDKVYKQADDNSKMGFPGVKFGVAKSRGKGISMDYTFAVPVAFGVKLFPLSFDKTGGLSSVLSVAGSRERRPGEPLLDIPYDLKVRIPGLNKLIQESKLPTIQSLPDANPSLRLEQPDRAASNPPK